MPQEGLLNFHIHFVLTQQARIGVPKRMPSNMPDASCDAGGNQMILTNLTRPIRISCLRVGEDPFRINGLRSLSMLPKDGCEVSIHGKRLCGTFCLCIFHIAFHPGPKGVVGLVKAGQSRGRWTVHRVAVADNAGWIKMCGVADLIWLESPSNPLLTVADLDAICAAPRKRGAILGVDNTFATPLNQRPLALGADVAVQSVTKFIGGHSDLLGGVVTVRDTNLLAVLRQAREVAGATPGTLETFLAVRGARTLALRLERAQRNAMTLAERLAHHPNVTLARYPGLASHPTHEAARRQLKGFGTIISFDVRGDASAADAVCAGLQLIQHATSLGAVESTIERRASIPGQEHLPPALLRLSVGIEAVEDLWTDLDRALRNLPKV